MPRMTRAAARTQIHEDDVDQDAAQVPLPQTPQQLRQQPQVSPQRAPLGEITINPQEEEERNIQVEVNLTKPNKKPNGKGKKKGGKKPKKADETKENGSDSQQDDDKENTPEVAEDHIPSRPSSAAEEACANLLKETKQAANFVYDNVRPNTPPSRAVRSARKQLSPNKLSRPQTPRFDPKIHRPIDIEEQEEQKEDSFVKTIETRSPSKLVDDPFVDESPSGEAQSPMSPSRLEPVNSPRPEDSIDAIDAAVEALEALDHNVPEIEDDPISPNQDSGSDVNIPSTGSKTAESGKSSASKSVSKPVPKLVASKKSMSNLKTVTTKKSTTDLTKTGSIRRSTKPPTKPISPRIATKPIKPRLATSGAPGAQPKLAVAKRPVSTVSSTTSKPAAKPPTKPLDMPIRQKTRVSSISKTPFVPIKSTKAPTTSSFTLPGDAVAARLKEQREKRQVTQPATKPAVKSAAKPATKAATIGRMPNARVGPNGTIRQAKAPRASVLINKTNEEKRIVSNTSIDSMAVNVDGVSNSPSKRNSSLRVNTASARASILPTSEVSSSTSTLTTTKSSAPSSATIKSKAPTVVTNAPRVSYLSKTMPANKPTVTKPSARDIFKENNKVEEFSKKETKTLTRKEREEAAKKARAEASERGRLASKEWADKMKAKQAATKAKVSTSEGQVQVQMVEAAV